jgi:hypothetical protein
MEDKHIRYDEMDPNRTTERLINDMLDPVKQEERDRNEKEKRRVGNVKTRLGL